MQHERTDKKSWQCLSKGKRFAGQTMNCSRCSNELYQTQISHLFCVCILSNRPIRRQNKNWKENEERRFCVVHNNYTTVFGINLKIPSGEKCFNVCALSEVACDFSDFQVVGSSSQTHNSIFQWRISCAMTPDHFAIGSGVCQHKCRSRGMAIGRCQLSIYI